ncbi:hypothetical protein FGSG_07187 [Fusarium graminearum PH-1]|uniref:hypothetical protein n=1 Tax=Gibberella zeae (strain ATCC MYA-4620 / CBS 123657 / FGSC 9075 / NRRL 31084 / PH-1) TaxID=229533 RepID=UPI000023CCAF|nr:hypothetical protein FGSG_07187 [Fusarium graminearum PH-1]ESU13402.1 hypothetical protein FGSG_07187 [Fusarium graminearum PH-1]|eukprot:XP_011326909.1 hypothetical protein FGSG_07187 [Fusarium graminearum PH-1]
MKKYKCPYANQCDCNETFESQEAASNHSFGHDVTPLHIRDGQFLCPYTEDFGRKGCKATFGTIGEINGHISSVHKEKGIPIPCPISSDCEITGYRTEGLRLHCDVHHRKKHTYPCPYEDCDKSYPLHSSLYDHIQTKHSGKKFVCHLCGKELKSRTGLRDHINSPAHNDKTYPCPHKDDPVIQYPEEFRSAFLAKTHARNEHEGHKDDEKKIHTFPGAGDPYNCTEKSSDKSNARSHYRDVHLKVTQKCPHCGIDVKNLTKHLKYHEKEFLCPDSACTKRLDTSEEALLHVTDPSHQPNVSMFDCPFSSCHLAVKGRGLLKHALVNHWNMHIRKGHVSHEEKLVLIPFKRRPFRMMELFEDIYKSGKFIDHTCNTDSGDSNSPEDDQEDQHEEDQEIENRKANEDKAVSLATRGQNCPGASSVKDGLVLERCQFLTIIDLDTARLKQRKGKTILEGRCVECQASLREKQLLSRFTNSSLDGLKDVDVNSLRERFTNYTQTKWQVPADYQTVMDIAEKIKAGNRLGTKLVVLDVEFSPVSDQVWEIAVVEFVSGKVVINALVDHGDDIRHTFSSYKTPKLLEEVSKSVHRKVYSQEGRLKKYGNGDPGIFSCHNGF